MMVTRGAASKTMPMNILNRFKASLGASDDIPYQIYGAVVAQARQSEFYADAGVPDNLDGRFDMIVLHTYLVIDRLNSTGDDGKALAQDLFDVLFQDMDRSLREIGVGDLSVPKKIKVMAKAFYGRCAAYDEALKTKNSAKLSEVIERNLFAEIDTMPAAAPTALAKYMKTARKSLESQDSKTLLMGQIDFPTFSMPKKGA